MFCVSNRAILSFAVITIMSISVRAEEQAKPNDNRAEEELVIKVYRVLGLVTPAPDYSYEGTYLPAMPDGRANRSFGSGGTIGGAGGGMGGGMGGMGGGMGGGGMGGGMFRIDDNLAQVGGGQGAGNAGAGVGGPARPTTPAIGPSATAHRRPGPRRIEMNQLIDAITSIVEPGSWDEVGGDGSIVPIGGALAIRQTPAIQSKVQSFLKELQRESGTLRVLTIDAQWVLLNKEQLTQLHATVDPKKPSLAGQTINREALRAIPAETRRYAGKITCFNGQTVHIISGRLETVIQGAIPVVGGTEVGYQPILLTPHVGVLLQVTPSALPGDEGVMIDLQSSVTRWDEPEKPVQLQRTKGQPVVQVDRLKMTAQQFATSMRMPLNRPVLVGGMTFPDGESDELEGQLYLIVEVQSDQEP